MLKLFTTYTSKIREAYILVVDMTLSQYAYTEIFMESIEFDEEQLLRQIAKWKLFMQTRR